MKKCLHCKKESIARGLCANHYVATGNLLRDGLSPYKEMIEKGIWLPKNVRDGYIRYIKKLLGI